MTECDPYGVGWCRGVDVFPGSSTPGYGMGMLRIPEICCTLWGAEETIGTFYPGFSARDLFGR